MLTGIKLLDWFYGKDCKKTYNHVQPLIGGDIPSSPDSGECGLFSSVDVRSGPNKCSLIVSLITFCTILQE